MTATAPAGPGMRATLRTAGRLLGLAAAKASLGRKRNPFPPLVHLILNIFFCAFAQRYIEDDPDGVYLPLFIGLQCLLGVLITLGFVGRTGAEILEKTRLFPGSAPAAYYFLLAGSLRRPEWYLFTAVGCVFPAFVYAPGLGGRIAIAAMAALCVLSAQTVCCALSVRLVRSSLPLTGLAVAAVGAAAAITASVFVFRTGALAKSLPMAGWAAAGTAAFAAGDAAAGWKYLLGVAAAAGALMAVFRK